MLLRRHRRERYHSHALDKLIVAPSGGSAVDPIWLAACKGRRLLEYARIEHVRRRHVGRERADGERLSSHLRLIACELGAAREHRRLALKRRSLTFRLRRLLEKPPLLRRRPLNHVDRPHLGGDLLPLPR